MLRHISYKQPRDESLMLQCTGNGQEEKETKRKDYAFWRQFDEKPSDILGCTGMARKCTSACPVLVAKVKCSGGLTGGTPMDLD